MIKPSVCDNKVCTFSHEQYGLGADVASEIRDNHTVVDMLLTLAFAGASGDVKRFSPFPVGCEARTYDSNKRETLHNFMQDTNKNAQKVTEVLNAMPKTETLKKYKDTRQIKEYLETIHPLAFPLLRWSITSNRAHLARLEPEDQIKEMNTEFQYMFLSSPPEKEAEFQKLKKEKGSFWAFHVTTFPLFCDCTPLILLFRFIFCDYTSLILLFRFIFYTFNINISIYFLFAIVRDLLFQTGIVS